MSSMTGSWTLPERLRPLQRDPATMWQDMRRYKQDVLGWVGLACLVVGLLATDSSVNIRFIAITMGVGMIGLALPKRVWVQVRTWWRQEG